jgi:hypothetical protein
MRDAEAIVSGLQTTAEWGKVMQRLQCCIVHRQARTRPQVWHKCRAQMMRYSCGRMRSLCIHQHLHSLPCRAPGCEADAKVHM